MGQSERGLQAFSVVDVYDLYLFVFDDIGRIHKSFVDGYASHILKIGFFDGDLMYF